MANGQRTTRLARLPWAAPVILLLVGREIERRRDVTRARGSLYGAARGPASFPSLSSPRSLSSRPSTRRDEIPGAERTEAAPRPNMPPVLTYFIWADYARYRAHWPSARAAQPPRAGYRAESGRSRERRVYRGYGCVLPTTTKTPVHRIVRRPVPG